MVNQRVTGACVSAVIACLSLNPTMLFAQTLAQTIVVTTTNQQGVPGDCTLTDAILAANSRSPVAGCATGNVIVLPAGTFLMSMPYLNGSNALPRVTVAVEIRGAGADQTIIARDSAAPAFRFFEVPVALTLRGLTLKGGQSDTGGAIFGQAITVDHVVMDGNVASSDGGAVSSDSLTATASTFSANTAGGVGGVYATCGGTGATFTNSMIVGNSAVSGGAVRAAACYGNVPTVTATDSTFMNNLSQLGNAGTGGGAIEADRALLAIDRSRFLNNRSGGAGGAINGAQGTITNSTFSGNQATTGGAVYSGDGSLIIGGSTFDGNISQGDTGAIGLNNSLARLVNVTITNNTAAGAGGGLTYGASASPLTLNNVTIAGNTAARGGGTWYYYNGTDFRLGNTIVAGNTATSGNWPDLGPNGRPYHSDGYNLIGNSKDANYTAATGDLIGTAAQPFDPRLAALAPNGGPTRTQELLDGSPALAAGNPLQPGSAPTACEPTDQRGRSRPGVGAKAARCNIGAYEKDTPATADLVVDKSVSTPVAYTGQVLTYSIRVHNNGGMPATGVVVSDPLPPVITPSSASASSGSCSVSGQSVNCSVGVIQAGTSATVQVVATANVAGTVRNAVTVTSAPSAGAPAGGIAAAVDVWVHEPIVVNTRLQVSTSPTDCTLTQAIQAANTYRAVGGCRAGRGPDLILLPAGAYLMTTVGNVTNGPTALPTVTGELEIRGTGPAGTSIERDGNAPAMRLLQVRGVLTLRHLTIRGGSATGQGAAGSGGAIFGGTITTEDVVFDRNTASADGGVFAAAWITLSNSRVTNNLANGNGGVASDGSFTAINSTVSGNAARLSGGVYASCGGNAVTIISSTLSGNSGGADGGHIAGGAIANASCYGLSPSVTIVDSAFLNNSSGSNIVAQGGGAIGGGAVLTIVRSRFLGNTAISAGGAIETATGTIVDSTFSGNKADVGGAIATSQGRSLTVLRSTFAANTAIGDGGALALDDNLTRLVNVTITNNTAGGRGGGLGYGASASPLTLNNVTIAGNTAARGGGTWFYYNGVDVRLANTIVAGNTATSGNWPDLGTDGRLYHSDGYNLIGNSKDANYTAATSDLIGTAAQPFDPLLGPLQDNGSLVFTRALLPGSPAIDAGSPAPVGTPGACDPVDARGVARPQGSRCDIGAVEASAATAELSLSASVSPSSPAVGSRFAYLIIVSNHRPSSATGVNVTVNLPPDVTLGSITASQGRFTQPAQKVIFNVGTIALNANAMLTIDMLPTVIGKLTFSADAVASEAASQTASLAVEVGPATTLTLSDSSPAAGGVNQLVLLTVSGRGIVAGATMALTGNGFSKIAEQTTVTPNTLSAFGLFDLHGVPLGPTDVVVTNPEGQSTVLTAAFTVEAEGKPQISIDVLGPDTLRHPDGATYTIVLSNSGNGDAYMLPLYVATAEWVSPKLAFGVEPPQPSNLPPGVTLNYSNIPKFVRDGSIPTTVTYPFILTALHAGQRLTLSLPVSIPINPRARAFTIRVYTRASLGEWSGSAPPMSMSAGASVLGRFSARTPACPIGETPEAAHCTLAKLNVALSTLGIIPIAGPIAGCAVNLLLRPGTLIPLCVLADDLSGANAFGLTTSWFAGVASLAAACAPNAGAIVPGLGQLLSGAQLVSALSDVLDNCESPLDRTIREAKERKYPVQIVDARDPNAKIGAQGGGGDAHYLTGNEPLRYEIEFENKPEATAAAQTVIATDRLDPTKVDLNTFRFGPVRVGDLQIDLPRGTDVTTDTDLRPAQNLILRVRAALDRATNVATWRFSSLDPNTGDLTTDRAAGFLPPDTAPPAGRGSVIFFVQPVAGAPTGTTITNTAQIVFDTNNPVDTNQWSNTIDSSLPSSRVTALPEQVFHVNFPVSWSGTDQGSGIQDFTLFVSTDGAVFRPWLVNTTSTSALFTGAFGHRYGFHSQARDLAGNVEGSKTSAEATTQVVLDTTPPTTMATVAGLNGNNGWHRGPVQVTLSATDPDSAVSSTSFRLEEGLLQTYAAPFSVSGDGTHQLSYFSVDPAGNQETPNSLAIRIDGTPPVVTGTLDRSPNGAGWYNGGVTITWTATDATSGVATTDQPSLLSSEGLAVSATGHATDSAGNVGGATVEANIDKTAPLLTVAESPPPNANGWNNTDVTVTFFATDALSGVALVSSPVVLTSEGAKQPVTGSAVDHAGNTAVVNLVVSIDKTPPEAFSQFDPSARDAAVFGRDALSGVAPGPVMPVSVVPFTEEHKEEHGEDDDKREAHEHHGNTLELRTYKIFDLAGNSLVLVEKVAKSNHEAEAKILSWLRELKKRLTIGTGFDRQERTAMLEAEEHKTVIETEILSFQYNNGPVLKAPRNRRSYEGSYSRDGRLRELKQRLTIGTGIDRQEWTAKFEAEEHKTVIEQEGPEPEKTLVRSGLVLLRMVTDHGKLVIEF